MSTNKFSKYVIDNIVVGTPISSIVAAGATLGLDSAAVTALIDSDYVQQRETSGLDSAEVIALIDSDYVAARTPAANGGGLDSASALDLFSYGIAEVGPNQKQVAVSLNKFVDPFNQTGNNDRTFNLNYTSTTGMFIRETGGRTEINADASGSSLSTGLFLTGATFSDVGTEIAGNLKLPDLPTTDPAEVGLLWNDGGIPVFSGSTAPTGGGGLDSAGVLSVVTSSDLDMGGNKVLFGNVYSSEADLPNASTYHGMFAHVHSTGAGYFAHAGNWVRLANNSDLGAGGGLDSSAVTALVDSDYVGGRVPPISSYRLSNYYSIPATYAEVNDLAIGNGAQVKNSGGGVSPKNSIAIGQSAETQGDQSISIGQNAISNSNYCTVIGANAGTTAAGQMVCVGNNTNADTQSTSVGYDAGVGDGFSARNVALGYTAGKAGNTVNSVAIGNGAGSVGSGRNNSIAIGFLAGQSNQAANNIIVNATGSAINRSDRFGIDIRTSASGSLTYDTTNDWTFGAGVTMTDLTASGATVVFSNLPTSDPANAGQLWNDSGTLKVSAG